MVKFVIDTSVWIETFRPGGDKSLGDLVKQLIRSGRVLLPDIIKTELLRGAKTLAEFERLEDLLEGLTYLPLNESFWDELAAFSFNLFRKGLTVPLKVLEPVAPKTCSRPGWGHTPLNPRSGGQRCFNGDLLDNKEMAPCCARKSYVFVYT